MNCLGVPVDIAPLARRSPAGLKRPRKEIPGLGTIELVRDGTAHAWETVQQFVPSRRTRVSGILMDDEDGAEGCEFLRQLRGIESDVRRRFVTAWRNHLAHTRVGCPDLTEILDHLDDWVAPYHIMRELDGCELCYDCTDAPGGHLLGAAHIAVTADHDWSIVAIGIGRLADAVCWQAEPFQQRVIPADCGFVMDSVADQLICWEAGSLCGRFNDELSRLLDLSLSQSQQLLDGCAIQHSSFLNAVRNNLLRIHEDQRRGALRTD